jgi:hypothetical protein
MLRARLPVACRGALTGIQKNGVQLSRLYRHNHQPSAQAFAALDLLPGRQYELAEVGDRAVLRARPSDCAPLVRY